jgi:LmbE family N-acetylglucosaminyl deacetylase
MKASASVDRRVTAAFGAIVTALAWLAVSHAQLRVQPVAEYPGEIAYRLALRKLTTIGTFVQATAHPDDEDNTLLAMLGHGRGMRTVLVSATRGEGGQNEIGPELHEALSVLRTAELEAAHRFDGAEQLFTRAVDFGYSFSVEENLDKWGRAEIVGDYVRHIRATRPHVVAGFVCGGDGGGQAHQAATALTIDAVRDAADRAKYPEQIRAGLRPWRVRRLFCTQGFGQPRTGPDLVSVNGDEFDPLLGRTYAELGTEARSMHKCQGTSQLLPLPGAGFARIYKLLDAGDSAVARPLNTMFDGIDTSLAGLARLAEGDASIGAALSAIAGAAAAADLPRGLGLVRDLRQRLRAAGLDDEGRYEIDFRLAQKARQFEQALLLKHGIRFEALADDGEVAEGQPVTLTVIAANPGASDLTVRRVSLAGFSETAMTCGGVAREGRVSCKATVTVGPGAAGMYWRTVPAIERYAFDPDVPFGAPFRPSPFRVTFEVAIEGQPIAVDREVEYRYSDIVAGEKRMALTVLPGLGVDVSPSIVVVPRGAGRTASRAVRVTVVNNFKRPERVAVTLGVPAGWSADPATASLALSREDEAATVEFRVQPPAGASGDEYTLTATATSEGPGGPASQSGYQVIEYPHIRRRHMIRPAAARLKVIDARIAPGLRVGYIMGVGDQVPPAIEQLGASVQLIGPDELSAGDLSKYHVIVTGVRAYERRADLRATNHRLLAYAERGGTVLVQYNKFEFNEAQYGPFPAKVSANRVTDENAPVEILVPEHPVFSRPNRLGPDTWKGWVQERGLYFFGDRDPRYVDLVQLEDPFPFNAGPKTGALVEARVGKGRWIYIGLGLWRQLPAGTEGAYQLLANLLSVGASR